MDAILTVTCRSTNVKGTISDFQAIVSIQGCHNQSNNLSDDWKQTKPGWICCANRLIRQQGTVTLGNQLARLISQISHVLPRLANKFQTHCLVESPQRSFSRECHGLQIAESHIRLLQRFPHADMAYWSASNNIC